jgi:hypothetical protein
MAIVRAKGYVSAITHRAWNEGGLEVTFNAATKGDENKVWALATPMFEFKMTIKNPLASDVFHDALGKEFYIDFTPAEGDPT